MQPTKYADTKLKSTTRPLDHWSTPLDHLTIGFPLYSDLVCSASSVNVSAFCLHVAVYYQYYQFNYCVVCSTHS